MPTPVETRGCGCKMKRINDTIHPGSMVAGEVIVISLHKGQGKGQEKKGHEKLGDSFPKEFDERKK